MSFPSTFGKYLLLERVNVGGMAEVFKAKTFGVEGFQRVLAIKRILPNMADDTEFINMFVDEARIAVQLSHPNIVQIYELGKYETQLYIAMEYVSGKDLRQILDEFRKTGKLFDIAAAAYIGSMLCDGLDYAHRREDASGKPLNVIHRDVSPQNVLVSYDGAVKITDFGIAKAEDRASKTQAGVLKGKFGYMSPEQVKGQVIDHRSDIFALGILMYEMLTGKRLFAGESDFATLEGVRKAEVPPLRESNPAIPEELEGVVLRALAGDRDERFSHASEVHDALQPFRIVDNSIYGSKALSRFLAEEYAGAIAAERDRMIGYASVQPADIAAAEREAERMRFAPLEKEGTGAAEDRTMIYESEFIGADSKVQGLEDMARGTQLRRRNTSPEPLRGESSASGTVPGRQRPLVTPKVAQYAVGGLVAFLVLIFTYLVAAPSGDTGTLLITSRPVEDVDLFLDREPIGSGTPLILEDVPLGEHQLLAQAEGYQDILLSFELVGSNPEPIVLDFKTAGSPEPVPNVGTLIIASVPPGATVRVEGVPRGETPLTVGELPAGQPLLVEVTKADFSREIVSAKLEPGESVQLNITLNPLVPHASGSIDIQSIPSGARVFIEGIQRGVTPLKLDGFDPSKPPLVIVLKEGYRTAQGTPKFDGSGEAEMAFTLPRLSPQGVTTPEPRPRPKPRPRTNNRPKPRRSDCSGSGARLSVLLIGVSDCRVKVGKKDLGVAPLFKKDAPVGDCPVVITCEDGRSKRLRRELRAGATTKVILKESDI